MMAGQVWSEGAPGRGRETFQPRAPSSEGLPPSRPQDSRTIVATQVSLFYCENLKDVEERIGQLAQAGVNTLILRVFHNEGDRYYSFANPKCPSGVYFQTRYAPVVDDILGPVAGLAHRHGLKVFAWMTTRHANYGFEEKEGLRTFLYDFERNTTVPARGFNLFREEVVTRLEGLYSDLARYPIDGILFQDDLILRRNEGFSPEARQLFAQDHGYLPDPSLFYSGVSRDDHGRIVVSYYTNRFWTWARWKNGKLLHLAGRLMNAARNVRPNLQFALNVYYESVLDPEKGMAWYSQSLQGARELPFDYFSIMAYHRQMQDELGLTMEETLSLVPRLVEDATEMAGDPLRILMKVQVVDLKDSRVLPQEETEKVLQAVAERPGIHVALVPYQPDSPISTLVRSFKRAQVRASREGNPGGLTAMREPPPRFSPR